MFLIYLFFCLFCYVFIWSDKDLNNVLIIYFDLFHNVKNVSYYVLFCAKFMLSPRISNICREMPDWFNLRNVSILVSIDGWHWLWEKCHVDSFMLLSWKVQMVGIWREMPYWFNLRNVSWHQLVGAVRLVSMYWFISHLRFSFIYLCFHLEQ